MKLVKISLFGFLVSISSYADIEDAQKYESKISKLEAIDSKDYKTGVGLVLEYGIYRLPGLIADRVKPEDVELDDLKKMYLELNHLFWDQSSQNAFMSGLVELSRVGNKKEMLDIFEKDILSYKKPKLMFADSTWGKDTAHPAKTGLVDVIQWIADERGIDGLKKVYTNALIKERQDIVQAIIGGFRPKQETKLEAVSFFIKIYSDSYQLNDSKLVEGALLRKDMKLYASWLGTDFFRLVESIAITEKE